MTKKILLIVVIIFSLTLLVACSEQEDATIFQQEEQVEEFELEIAVVDKNQIWNDSLQADYYQTKLKEKFEAVETELKEAETNDLSEEEQLDLHDELYAEIRELRADLRSQTEEKINQKIATIADNKKYQVVFKKDETRFGGEDITELVINRLDENFERNQD